MSALSREDAIRMMRESEAGEYGEPFSAWMCRFAALAYAAGQAAEREACAKVCENIAEKTLESGTAAASHYAAGAEDCASHIRARVRA